MMIAYDTCNTPTNCLADMFAFTHRTQRIWAPEELGTLLKHQLDARLSIDLSFGQRVEALRIEDILQTKAPQIHTFRELFNTPHPPQEILKLAKTFFKTMRQEMDGLFATEVATVLYYAVLASAQHRLGHSLSSQNPAAQQDGYRWSLSQPWLDSDLRELFTACLAK